MKRTVTFDIESWDAELMWDMDPVDFVRLSGYSWDNEDEVHNTTDLEDLREVLRSARLIVGHNIHAFDLTAIFGVDSIEPLEMAKEGRVLDTWTHGSIAFPAPRQYTNRFGKGVLVKGPEQAKLWHALDEQCYQLGIEGKTHDLKAMAKEHGGFGHIPVDDEDYNEYLRGDVRASRLLARELLRLGPMDDYGRREQVIAAIAAQMSRNGWRVDQEAAQARVEVQDAKRDKNMQVLVEQFGMPTEGKAPLRSTLGKEAVHKALKSVGVKDKELKRTKNGALSFGSESVLEAVAGKGPEAEELGTTIAAIGGIRPLAEAALKHVRKDGKVHPQISTLQRSGRWSTQDPGLTTWTSRGEGAEEKRYFIPNADDEVLREFDLSQADARIVAAYSGDRKFAERFKEGADAHMITAYAVWGKAVVDTDPAKYRQTAKACGHAYAYRAGPGTISRTAKVPFPVAKKFTDGMESEYRKVTRWQDKVTKLAERGWVQNDWGRKMLVDAGREFTQGPALYGQSGTREIVCDGLILLPHWVLRMVVAQVHDALVLSIPEDRLEEVTQIVKDCMECYWAPSDGSGQKMYFPVGVGPVADNWADANH